MNCEEYEILLSARLDGALTPEETARLEAHLAQCPQCRQLAQELETLQAQTAALTQEVPRALQENLEGRDWSRVPQTGTAPSKKKKRLLPWAACAAAAVVLMVFGFTHLALPGGSSGLSEGFAALFSLPGDREESTATAEDSTQSADPEGEASDQTDGATPPGDGAAEGDTDAPPSDSAGEGNKDDGNTATDTPSDPPNEDPGGQPEDPGNDPGQDDPTNGEDPTTDPGLSQAEAQSLLIAYLAQQGRTLELIPLGQSGDVWRFSGRESDGTVVSFCMVARTAGTVSECPSHRHRAQRRRRQLTGFLPILTNFFLIFSILCCQCLIHVVYWFHHHGACHSVGAQDGDFPPPVRFEIRREHRYELFRAKHPQRLPSGPQRQRQDRPGREPAVHDRCPQAHGYQR